MSHPHSPLNAHSPAPPAEHTTTGVINQILEWSKISAVGAQTFELVQEPFTLGTLAEDLADIISMKADRGKIIVTIDCDAALRARTFIGDAFRLRQCLINLVRRFSRVVSGFVSLSHLAGLSCRFALCLTPPAFAVGPDIPRIIASQTDNAVKFSQEGKVVAVSFRQTSAPIDPTLDDAHANGSPGLSSSPSEGLRAFLNAVAMANSQRRSMSANNGTGSGSGPARVTENDNEEGTDADDTSASARRARQWVQITVLDQGEGMSPEAVKKLFKPFRRAPKTRVHARFVRVSDVTSCAGVLSWTDRVGSLPLQPSLVDCRWPPDGHGPGLGHR